jgi:hypothetical protein
MSVLKHLLPSGWYPEGLIVHQQRYRPSDSYKYVDIKFNAHDAFLEKLSSGVAQNRKIGKPNNLR